MGHSLHSEIKVIGNAVAATVAGATDVTGATIDMAGYEGVLFIVAFGALTAGQVTSIRAQQDSDSGAGTMADLLGSASTALADADGTKCLVLDVFRPSKRYVRVMVDRGTQNAVVDRGIAILYGPTSKPTALHTTTVKSQEVLVSPAEGTA